jgi:Holliday junction DNA helicase RuvA
MIASLQGILALKAPDHVIINVQGVGYRVWVSLETLSRLPDVDAEVFLNTYTHLRDDAIHLYGFVSPLEKELFLHLIGVSGIGCKLAVNVLSRIPEEELHLAIRDGNVARLKAIPGVGKKTAERIVVELSERLRKTAVRPAAAPPATSPAGLVEDALQALENLGYKRNSVENEVRRVADSMGNEVKLEELIRRTLRLLDQ